MKKIFLIITLLATGCSKHVLDGATPIDKISYQPEVYAKRLWSVNTGDGNRQRYLKFKPAVADNTLAAIDAKGVVSLWNIDTGKRLWRSKINQEITSAAAIAAGKVIIGTGEAYVIAFDQQTGQELWRREVSNEVLAAPVVVANTVVVKTVNGYLHALNVHDGKVKWQYKHGAPTLILRGNSQPFVINNKVVAGFDDGKVDALSLNRGELLWQRVIARPVGATLIERMIDIDASPVVDKGVVFVASYQGKLAAINLQSGDLVWEHDLSTYTGLTTDKNAVYVTDAKGHVWAFNKRLGTVLWKQAALENRGLTAPVIYRNKLLVADSQGYLHWLATSDGQLVGRGYAGRTGLLAAPVIYNDTIYTMTQDGRLSALKMS